jgi:hypothetical protein
VSSSVPIMLMTSVVPVRQGGCETKASGGNRFKNTQTSQILLVTHCTEIVHKICTQTVYEELGIREVCTLCINRSGERAKIEFWGILILFRSGSSVGIATGYGLDGLGIESR